MLFRSGAQKRLENQRKQKINAFDPTSSFQRMGNLVRWGVKINGVRVPYAELSEDFLAYYKYHVIELSL